MVTIAGSDGFNNLNLTFSLILLEKPLIIFSDPSKISLLYISLVICIVVLL